MKRLILIILVLGLVVFTIHKSGLCPMGRHSHGAHVHDSYSAHFNIGRHNRRAVSREYEVAVRRAREAAERAALAEGVDHFRLRDDDPDARETVDGIPVPIVPGTRVADASPTPPQAALGVLRASKSDAPAEIHTATGRISATEDRARADALRQLREDVAAWLAPRVPSSWRPSDRQLEAMIVETRITPVEKPYATLYVAELDADFSGDRELELVRSHQQTVVRDRMLKLAALLAFVLICLAAVSGYIRTDEATKGYYTNRLRLLAAAGVGAAGVVIYQIVF